MNPETHSHGLPRGTAHRPLTAEQKAALLHTETVDSLARQTLNLTQITTFQALRDKLRALYRRDQYEIHERVLVFHDELKRKYPQAREYLLFHLISGSTFIDFNGHFDFPAPDSVEDFITVEYNKVFPDVKQQDGRVA